MQHVTQYGLKNGESQTPAPSMRTHIETFQAGSTSSRDRHALSAKLLAAICVLILAGILFAGLRPFHAPRNDVTWQEATGGLAFGKHGTVLGSGVFTTFGAKGQDYWSIEMWLQPNFRRKSETLLAVYSQRHPTQMRIYRYQNGIVLQGEAWDTHGRSATAAAYIADVLSDGKLSLITITSGADGTTVYLNGVRVEHKSYFRLSNKSLNGQLVVGNSPIEDDSWTGLFTGLALYDQELTDAVATRHYESWAHDGRPEIQESERMVALYLFDERHGNVVHNYGGSSTDLIIPLRYTILHEKFLDAPWNEFHADWGDLKNILINIGGFIPLGFFFCAYWSATRPFRPIAIATVLLGFLISLTIEIGQSQLPTRDSGMTDLITNTFGTYLGVALHGRSSGLLRWSLNRVVSVVLRWSHPWGA